MLGLCPVLLGLISAGGGEVLRPRARGLFYQHPVTNCLPGVKPLLDPLPDCVECGDMTGFLQDYSTLIFYCGLRWEEMPELLDFCWKFMWQLINNI